MSVVDLIRKHVPRNWEDETKASHRGVLYQLFDVAEGSTEFRQVTGRMHQEGFVVTSLQRLQNVTMFGRYLLRHQQLASRYPGRPLESQRFVVINRDDVDLLGTYNVDHRRLGLRADALDLHSSPTEAHAAHMFKQPAMVACRVSREGNSTQYDSEVYPEYVIGYTKAR